MGRQLDLERLALGRSAFEDAEPVLDIQDGQQASTELGEISNAEYRQQYDSKGRPKNPLTDERNKAFREAQNSVYYIVNAVESVSQPRKPSEKELRRVREAREAALKLEEESGEDLELLTTLIQTTFTWWPEALILRVQAGLYASSASFVTILLSELYKATNSGPQAFLGAAFPGLPASLLIAVLKTLLDGAVAEGVSQLQTWAVRQPFRRQTTKRILKYSNYAFEVIATGIDVALLPLQYHAEVQNLGLAPKWPLIPHWRSFLPTDPSSIHSFLWTSDGRATILGLICSPALLMVLRDHLTRDQDEETPIAHQYTGFEYPSIDEYEGHDNLYEFKGKDSLGEILSFGYRLRLKVIQWCGWHVVYPGESHEISGLPPFILIRGQGSLDTTELESGEVGIVCRSSPLARQPARYLAGRLDALYQKLLMLPFESLMLRAIAKSYICSNLPRTPLAFEAAPLLYTAFGGGPLRSGSWTGACSHMSKLGLGLVLQCSTEIGIFFLLYRQARYQGLRHYRWAI